MSKTKSQKNKSKTHNTKLLNKLNKLARETKLINNGNINIYDVIYHYDESINNFEENIQLGGSKLYIDKNGTMTLEEAMYDSFRRQYNLKN